MPSHRSTQHLPPAPDELELSLFGPGVGECAVLHLGNGDWMVVDSCLSAPNGPAVALTYFDQMGVDVPNSVKIVVATHWHDDHTRGLAQVLRSANRARFACTAAINHPEFYALTCLQESVQLVEATNGVAEFAEIIEILQQRRNSRYAIGPHIWAQDGVPIYRASTGSKPVEVYALSPSSQSITDSKGELAQYLFQPGDVPRRFQRPSPNRASVVLFVKSGGMHFLLGGDLERAGDENRGWQAVARSLARQGERASAYKVAHHGSENADDPVIWSELVVSDPYAVLTPYAAGRNPLPSNQDVQRLRMTTSRAFSTCWPLNFVPRRRKGIDGIINRIAMRRRAVRARPGHIRLRVPLNGSVSDFAVDVFDGAARIP